MKINNTSTTGIFIYSDKVVYEKDDFVIYNRTIYICKSETTPGEIPSSDSEKFEIYLGKQSASIDEFIDFIDNDGENTENNYISIKNLKSILNVYMLGLDGKGIIGDSITYSKTTGFKTDFKNINLGTKISQDDILSEILVNPNINNAIFRVSRLLPEIYLYVGRDDITDNSSEDEKSCILKQYTYLSETNNERIRVQELIDPLEGLIYYRSSNIDSDINNLSSFKCAIINTKDIKEKADNLFKIYSSKLMYLDKLSDTLKNNFRYCSLKFKTSSTQELNYVEIQGNSKNEDNYVNNLTELTCLVIYTDNEGRDLYKTCETTVNLSERLPSGEIPLYYLTDTLFLSIKELESNKYSLSLQDENGDAQNAWFTTIFYKDYYV